MLRPVSRMVILASVELNGELMQETNQIWHWNELEAIFYFVLITIKGFFNFSICLKHKEENNTNKNLFWAPSIIRRGVLICGSSPTLINHYSSFSTIVETFIWFQTFRSQPNDNQKLKPIYQD